MYFLETKNCYLQRLSIEHCTIDYVSWLNDKDVTKYLETGDYPTSLESLKEYVNAISNNELYLAIHLKETGVHIGNIRIHKIDFKNGLAEYGIMIGDRDKWGKGYSKEVTIVVLKHCFNKLNLRKITLGVYLENSNAVKSYMKIGFVQEGIFKKHLYLNGCYEDVVRMAIFKESFLQNEQL